MNNLTVQLSELVEQTRNQLSVNALVMDKFIESDNKFNNVLERLDNLELNEEITSEQSKYIKNRAKARVMKFLDYERESKYYRVFIRDLYKYLGDTCMLGSPIEVTRKRNYDNVVKGIDAWVPDVERLKTRKDNLDKYK